MRAVVAGATLASFVLAAVFFLLELLVFKTLGWKTALQPLIVAGKRMPCMQPGRPANLTSRGKLASELSHDADSLDFVCCELPNVDRCVPQWCPWRGWGSAGTTTQLWQRCRRRSTAKSAEQLESARGRICARILLEALQQPQREAVVV